jgi:hypothetical protein
LELLGDKMSNDEVMKNQKTKATVVLISLLTMILLVTFLGCSKSPKAAKKSFVDDFRGIKWFTKKSNIPDFEKKYELLYYNFSDENSEWVKKDEDTNLGDTPVNGISYIFCGVKRKGGDGEFCKVDISYDSINYDRLVSFFTQTLNVSPAKDYKQKPTYSTYGGTLNITKAIWNLPTVKIKVYKSFETPTETAITTCTIEAKKEKSKTGGGL